VKPEHYREDSFELAGWPVHMVSYKLGDMWICKIDNVSPGAQIARSRGATREETVKNCCEKAERRLRAARRMPSDE
jgi:hypothetical protein